MGCASAACCQLPGSSCAASTAQLLCDCSLSCWAPGMQQAMAAMPCNMRCFIKELLSSMCQSCSQSAAPLAQQLQSMRSLAYLSKGLPGMASCVYSLKVLFPQNVLQCLVQVRPPDHNETDLSLLPHGLRATGHAGLVFFAFALNLVDCGALLGGRLGEDKSPAALKAMHSQYAGLHKRTMTL